jgi:hypothetical protein
MIQQRTLLKITQDDFEEWLTRASWNMHQDSEPEALKMVGEIELWISEMDAGHRSHAEFLGNLAQLSGIFEMGEVPSTPVQIASANAVSFPFTGQFELSVDADRRYEVEFSYTPLLPA